MKTKYYYLSTLTFFICLFSLTKCNENSEVKSVQQLKKELLPVNFEQTANELFDAINSGLQASNYEQGLALSIEKLGRQYGASDPEIQKSQNSMLKKRTGSVDNSFFVKNFSQESKNHFDNLLAIFNDMTKYSYDNTFDFNSFAKSSLDHIDDVEKQVVFDVKISKQEKQLILVASTLITAALFSMEGTSKLLSSSQNNGRVNCFFCSVWQGIVKFTSVVVAIVVNVVAGTMISFFSGLLEGGPLAAPFCAVGGAFVGLFYGIRDGIVCDSYDFDCMLQSLMPPDDYPCFVEV